MTLEFAQDDRYSCRAMEYKTNLSERVWPTVLTTSSADLIKDFFEPALRAAESYSRGVGFFSGAWMRLAAEGMTAFAARGGYARWVTSPILTKDDWEALWLGEQAKTDEVLRQALLRNVQDLRTTLHKDTLRYFSAHCCAWKQAASKLGALRARNSRWAVV